MLKAADKGILYNAPETLIKKYSNFDNANNYERLKELLTT